jgi:hypothetical protein
MGFLIILLLAVVGIVVGVGMKSSGNRHGSTVSGIFVMLLVLIALIRCSVIVDAGNVGVVNRFGTVSPQPLLSGIHFIDPFANVGMLSVRDARAGRKNSNSAFEGRSEGRPRSIGHTSIFDAAKAPEIFKTVGRNYAQVVLETLFRSSRTRRHGVLLRRRTATTRANVNSAGRPLEGRPSAVGARRDAAS